MKGLARITFWQAAFIVFAIAGLISTYVRFVYGLGAATNLSDQFPWGMWIGFDVLCGVGLAAGGFTLMAIVHIFNLKKYRPILRPTVLTAFLGYLLVIVALLYDLGRPYRIWHAVVMWNPHSVMFEVAWCVMLYTAVLALEFTPVVLEKFNLQAPLRLFRAITIPLVIIGVILSTLHQSSLGSLYLIVPNKLHALWYSPLLPLHFFISSIMVGLAMIIFESFLSERAFGKHLEFDLLQDLSRGLLFMMFFYGLVRFIDLRDRDILTAMFTGTEESLLFLLEVGVGLLLPIILLSFPKTRQTRQGLFISAVSVVLGFVLHRLNVAVTGMQATSGTKYFPSWMEISVTIFLVAIGFATFRWVAKNFTIFPTDKEVEIAPLYKNF